MQGPTGLCRAHWAHHPGNPERGPRHDPHTPPRGPCCLPNPLPEEHIPYYLSLVRQRREIIHKEMPQGTGLGDEAHKGLGPPGFLPSVLPAQSNPV